MVSSFWENLSYIWNYRWSLLRKQEQNPWECSFIKRSIQSFRAYKGHWRKEWHSFQKKTGRKHNQLGPPSLNKIQSILLLEWLKLAEKDDKGLARAFDLILRHTSTLFSRSPWSNTVVHEPQLASRKKPCCRGTTGLIKWQYWKGHIFVPIYSHNRQIMIFLIQKMQITSLIN